MVLLYELHPRTSSSGHFLPEATKVGETKVEATIAAVGATCGIVLPTVRGIALIWRRCTFIVHDATKVATGHAHQPAETAIEDVVKGSGVVKASIIDCGVIGLMRSHSVCCGDGALYLCLLGLFMRQQYMQMHTQMSTVP